MRRTSRQLNRSLRRPGLTLIEMLVTVGLVAIVIVTVSQIFRVTADAAAVTEANASLIQKSRIINETLEREVGNLAPGSFLAIVAPPPLRQTREIKGGPTIPLDINTIAFAAHGNPDAYESFATDADPTTATLEPVTSSEALVYFGPGNAMTTNPVGVIQPMPLENAGLFTLDWPFVHRDILLVPKISSTPQEQAIDMTAHMSIGGIFNNQSGLLPRYANGEEDVIYSSDTVRANSETIAQIIMSKDWNTDLASNYPSITALWSRSLAPSTVALNPLFSNQKNFYRRSGATMMFGLANFRVEWTDGQPIDPIGPDGMRNTGDENLDTRWFGVRPDPDQVVSDADLDALTTYVNSSSAEGVPYYAFRRQDVTPRLDSALTIQEAQRLHASQQALSDIYRDKIEWPRGNNSVGTDQAMYRAIWRADTWQYRPKALRFTYRLYDENQRIKNVTEVDFDRDGDPDPDGVGVGVVKRQMVRMGREFSVVVPVP